LSSLGRQKKCEPKSCNVTQKYGVTGHAVSSTHYCIQNTRINIVMLQRATYLVMNVYCYSHWVIFHWPILLIGSFSIFQTFTNWEWNQSACREPGFQSSCRKVGT